jgi:hypothetical protein
MTVRMSRATLEPEMGAVVEECLENLDKMFQLSRTTLERELVRRLASLRRKTAGELVPDGQPGP